MDIYILGNNYANPSFSIHKNYRGVSRNFLPKADKKTHNKSLIGEEIDKYYNLALSEGLHNDLKSTFNIAKNYTILSGEKFEVIVLLDEKEIVPTHFKSLFLGYEVIVSETENSMIFYWLAESIKDRGDFENIYIDKLNKNYLFPDLYTAEKFIIDLEKTYFEIFNSGTEYEIEDLVIKKVYLLQLR